MATVALGAAGGALGGPIGQAIGAAIGSYVDNAFLFPALFPQDPVEGPRIGDLRVQTADEGAPKTRCFGAENRLAGTLIWTSGLKETSSTDSVGGKGGGGVQQTTYTYAVDVAVSFCEGPPDGLGIKEFSRILGNTKTLYVENPDKNANSTLLTATAGEVTTTNAVPGSRRRASTRPARVRKPSYMPSKARKNSARSSTNFIPMTLSTFWTITRFL